ncbi:putative ABC transport system permease protein [Catalinimonas alkaloidigena]|uniref:Putative ABC transport system permease protein n=1 Tax=Catalinimonas alkaloidigena TaxID=1075417 RepID=A0A1G9JHA5_9BACT|nr:ABC transporter permease [Catalinimonas alkaloidigena]SDL36504.1 putative ABC transport system permease protein [Catalinimonas alkaloidigena]
MFDFDKWQEIWATIRKNKLRTFLTMFGVFWGIFMLLLLLGAGKGLQNGVLDGFGGRATNSFNMWSQATTMPYAGMKPGRYFDFTTQDMQAIRQQIPEAEVICPRNQLGGWRGTATITRGLKSEGYNATGDVPDYTKVQKFDMMAGRFINEIDMKEKRKSVVIGRMVYEELFEPGEDAIGQYVKINGVYFMVVGVFNMDVSGNRAERELRTVYLPFATVQQTYNYGDRVNWFIVISKPGVPASEVEEKVEALLASRHKVHPDDKAAIGSWNMEREYKQLVGLFTGIKVFVGIVGLGTLLAGIIGVSNIMLIIVKERTREIGIRKAIGATPGSIISLILQESIVITAIAGYLGLLGGIALLEAINNALESAGGVDMFARPGVSLQFALLSFAIIVIGGGLAGLLPASKAAAIQPIEAIRDE